MNNALAIDRGVGGLPTAADWKTMLQMSDELVKSGMLPKHITTPQACVAIIQRGRELGIPPMYALSNIVYIQGKPTANSELMLALIYRDHGNGALIWLETTEEVARCKYSRRGDTIYKRTSYQEFSYTIEDAKKAGLLTNPTWQKYPAAMLRARAISAIARMAFPDSIGGMYLPEELGVDVEMDREGGIIISGDVIPVAPHGNNTIRQPVEVIHEEAPQQMQATADDMDRIARALSGTLTTGSYNLLLDEIERFGIETDPTISMLLHEVNERRDKYKQKQLVEA